MKRTILVGDGRKLITRTIEEFTTDDLAGPIDDVIDKLIKAKNRGLLYLEKHGSVEKTVYVRASDRIFDAGDLIVFVETPESDVEYDVRIEKENKKRDEDLKLLNQLIDKYGTLGRS